MALKLAVLALSLTQSITAVLTTKYAAQPPVEYKKLITSKSTTFASSLTRREVDPESLYPEYNLSVPIDHFQNKCAYEPHEDGTFSFEVLVRCPVLQRWWTCHRTAKRRNFRSRPLRISAKGLNSPACPSDQWHCCGFGAPLLRHKLAYAGFVHREFALLDNGASSSGSGILFPECRLRRFRGQESYGP